jgi:hypothetical protein
MYSWHLFSRLIFPWCHIWARKKSSLPAHRRLSYASLSWVLVSLGTRISGNSWN